MPIATPDRDRPRRRRRSRPAPRPRSTPVSRARSQEQQYVSQGRAVQRAAGQQRRAAAPRATGPKAFEPFRGRHGIERQQVAARDRSRRAERRLPDNPTIPHVPLLHHYTPTQRTAVRRIYNRAAKRAGVRSVTELYQLASPRQRQQMRRVGQRVMFGEGNAVEIQARNQRDVVRAGPEKLTVGKTVKGFLLGGPNPVWQPAKTKAIGDTAVNVGIAAYEDPEAVAKSTLRTGKESITGIPQGIKMLADDPLEAINQIAKDYEDRYGSVTKDPKAFRERVKNEWGLTPFVFDAAALAGGSGQALGALARSGSFARAARVLASEGGGAAVPGARALGRAAERVHRVATEERPGLRFSAGEGGVRAQRTSRNLFVAGGQKSLDKARRRAFSKVVRNANLHEGPGGRMVTSRGPEGRRNAKRIMALRPGENEVIATAGARYGPVTLPSARDLPGLRRYTGRVARDLGGQQSTTRLRLLTHRGRVLGRVAKQLRKLDESESTALKYMLQLGATPDEAGLRVLQRRAAQIKRAREGRGTQIAPILEDTNDELRVIRAILRDPERYLTPRTREVADELRAIQLEEAARDPDLAPEQELARRVSPQGRAIGVEREMDADFFRSVLSRLEQDTETPGLAGFADELAPMFPGERRERTSELAGGLRGQVRAAERDVDTRRRRRDVTAAVIREREQRGVPIDTAEVREARGQLAAAKRDRSAALRAVPRAERRAGEVRGRLGERERRGAALATPQVRAAREAVGAAQRERNRIETQLIQTEQRASRAQGRTEGRFAGGAMTEGAGRQAADLEQQRRELTGALHQADTQLADAQQQLRAVEAAAPRLTPGQFTSRTQATEGVSDAQVRLTEAEEQVRASRDQLDQVLRDAPRVSEALTSRLQHRELELAAARATREHVRDFEKAFRAVYRAARSKSTMRMEDVETFANRVADVAEAEGLAAPAYWWSSIRPEQMPSLAAAGRGVRATNRSRRYEGALFEIGAEEFAPNVYQRGVERNIKRRFQYALVYRNLETHAFEWSRGPSAGGLTVKQIKAEMDRRMIDPRSIELVDARVAARRANEQPGIERGQVLTEEQLADMDENDFVTTTQQDLASVRREWRSVTAEELRGHAMARYLVVPREVGETLDGVANKMDSNFWRGMEILLKQKPARILLGAANVPWLAFQVASNGLLTGLGGGVNPFNVYGAWKFWRGLDQEAKDALEAELGITHGHHFALDETNLGATNARYIATWRAFKQTRVMRAGHHVNPMNLMFRADEAQNNLFRRLLFYDAARKQAYRRMGSNWRSIDDRVTRLMDRVLAQPPERQMALIARHGHDFEQVAGHVREFLGDYLRFTPSERFLLSRNVMFYGYLRFSLRFTFYTMPVGHPIMADILGNIGRMGADEIKQLFGVPASYNLPANMLAQLYTGTRQDAKRGQLRSVPFGRFNPFLNTLTQLEGLHQAVGLVSPIYQALADQAYEESSFTGQDWRINGRPTPGQSERPRGYFGNPLSLLNPGSYAVPGVSEGRPRNRILQRDLFSLAFPYRAAEQVTLAPNQSDDALLWSPRPMGYADEEARRGVARSRREAAAEPLELRIGRQVLPVFPRITAAPQAIKREREKEKAMRERERRKPGRRKKPRQRKRPASTGGSYGGTSSGSGYGASSSSGAGRYGG